MAVAGALNIRGPAQTLAVASSCGWSPEACIVCPNEPIEITVVVTASAIAIAVFATISTDVAASATISTAIAVATLATVVAAAASFTSSTAESTFAAAPARLSLVQGDATVFSPLSHPSWIAHP
nr:hypothetical protein Iba_chr08dCG14100 [Ipomoea batatas]